MMIGMAALPLRLWKRRYQHNHRHHHPYSGRNPWRGTPLFASGAMPCRSFLAKAGATFFIPCSFSFGQYCILDMGKRREARERAVQFLFQHDLNPPEDLERALNEFWDNQRASAIADERGGAHWGQEVDLPPATAEESETRLFADPLIRGVLQYHDSIDEKIKCHAKNWEFHRIAAVDRNVMRLAIYEMFYRDDIPPVVSINEAVDIAKKFSTQDSGKFVNGILDRIRGEVLRPAKDLK
jgi:transcription antitermination protein NusB